MGLRRSRGADPRGIARRVRVRAVRRLRRGRPSHPCRKGAQGELRRRSRPLALLPRSVPPVALRLASARQARMLALDFVKANRETVERAIRDKGVVLDLSELLNLDAEVRGLKTEIDGLRAERNAVSAKFKDATPEKKAELGRQAKEAGARASQLEGALADKDAALKALMLKLPGIPYDGA